MKRILSRAIALIILVIGSSCSPTSSCNQLIDSRFNRGLSLQVTEDSMKDWVTQEYKIPRNQVADYKTDTQMFAVEHRFEWAKDGTDYKFVFVEGKLQRIHLTWSPSKRPQLGKLIECYGQPDAYRVDRFWHPEYPPKLFADFVYTKFGWVFGGEWPDAKQVTTTNLITEVRIVALQSPSMMVAAAYATVDGRDSRNVQPWPARIEDLTITTYYTGE